MITDDALVALRDNDDRLDNLYFYLDDYSIGTGVGVGTGAGFGGNNAVDDDDELTRAIRGNTRVTAVDVDMHLEEMTHPIGELMTAIGGQLVNLQSLRCSSSGDYAVTMAALAKAMAASSSSAKSKLASLELANFLLENDTDDDDDARLAARQSYRDFVQALRNHPTLKNVTLGFGYSSSSAASSSSSIDVNDNSNSNSKKRPKQEQQESSAAAAAAHRSLTPLLESLMTLPSLDWVRLDGAGFAPRTALTPRGLATLLGGGVVGSTQCGASSCSMLTTLEIHDFDLSTDHIHAMAKALETHHTNLRVLSLSCHKFYRRSWDDDDDDRCCATCANQTKNGTSAAKAAVVVATSMASALRKNTRLETLLMPLDMLTWGTAEDTASSSNNTNSNDNICERNVKSMVDFFRSLEVNQTLKKLQLNGPSGQEQRDINNSPEAGLLSGSSSSSSSASFSERILTHAESIQAFRHMLQHNYGLESIRVGVPRWATPEREAEIALHTRLNAMGRGRLVRQTNDTTRDQWMDAFGRVRDDLSCLFHLLLLNPLLCSTSRGSTVDAPRV